MKSSFAGLAEAIRKADSILLTTHSGPDGDGLGSVAALARAMRNQGKTTFILLPDAPADRYAFLDPNGEFRVFPQHRAEAEARTWDLGLVVDTHQKTLLGGVDDWMKDSGIRTLYFDHHPLSPDFDGTEIYGDATAVATGCLVYKLLVDELGWKIDKEIAGSIYISISYDTNSFKYLRNDPDALAICADLIPYGVDTTWVYRSLFASNPLRKARVLGWVLSHMEFSEDGRLASVSIPHTVIDEFKVERDDLRDAVTNILEISGVEIAAVLKEMAVGEVRISLRSKGNFTINQVAAAMNGGGHALAAGCEFLGPLDAAWDDLRPRLTGVMADAPEPSGA